MKRHCSPQSSAHTSCPLKYGRSRISRPFSGRWANAYIGGHRPGSSGISSTIPRTTLTFSRFQTFNFDGWSDYPDILEPLLFYVLQRASSEIEKPQNTATFKMFIIDEAWIFLKNRTIRDWITRAEKPGVRRTQPCCWRRNRLWSWRPRTCCTSLTSPAPPNLPVEPQHRPQTLRRNLSVERYPA